MDGQEPQIGRAMASRIGQAGGGGSIRGRSIAARCEAMHGVHGRGRREYRARAGKNVLSEPGVLETVRL